MVSFLCHFNFCFFQVEHSVFFEDKTEIKQDFLVFGSIICASKRGDACELMSQ